ncbi:MAG: NUDIX domain-containing protein [Patescibacteria group bacterium]
MRRNKQKYPEVTVGALIKNKKGEILLIRSPKWGNRFTLCGGHIEMGETAERALKREIREEVGLEIKNPRLLKVYDAIYPKEFWKKKHFIFLDYLCEAKTGKPKLDGREATKFIWADPLKALKLFIDQYTQQAILEYLKLLMHKKGNQRIFK